MRVAINHFEVESPLRDSGSTWSAAQAHGLLCSRLALMGSDGCEDWLRLILESSDGVGSAAEGTLDFLDRVRYLNLQLHGKEPVFLTPEMLESKLRINRRLLEHGFRIVMGDLTEDIPVISRHVKQLCSLE